MKKMILDSGQLGRVILWGVVFFSIWFTDFGETDISFAFFMIMLYFIFGSFFLDAMKNLWKYEDIRSSKQNGTGGKK